MKQEIVVDNLAFFAESNVHFLKNKKKRYHKPNYINFEKSRIKKILII